MLFARSIVGDLFKADIGEAAERVQYLFDRLIVQLSDKIDLISTVTVPIVEDARLLPLIWVIAKWVDMLFGGILPGCWDALDVEMGSLVHGRVISHALPRAIQSCAVVSTLTRLVLTAGPVT